MSTLMMLEYPDLVVDRSREAGLEYMRTLGKRHRAGLDVDTDPDQEALWVQARCGLDYDLCHRTYRKAYTVKIAKDYFALSERDQKLLKKIVVEKVDLIMSEWHRMVNDCLEDPMTEYSGCGGEIVGDMKEKYLKQIRELCFVHSFPSYYFDCW